MSKFKGKHRKIVIAKNETPPSSRSKTPLRSKSKFKLNEPLLAASANLENRKRTQPPEMANSTRRRMASSSSSLILCTLWLSVVQVDGQQLNNILQQYARSSSQQNLVNNMPQPPTSFYSNVVAPESLPLSRTPYGQSSSMADLDNVIESTTMNSLQHQPLLVARASALNQQPAGACQLPPTWAGKWYQANKEPIRVTNTEISDKGICRDKKGDKYLFAYVKPDHHVCLTCLVINARHLNVLQYKESSCQPVPAQYLNRTSSNSQISLDNDHSLLDSICSDITGDAQLESLFRLETPSIECPISGKYHFTYDNCREPLSSLDSCIDKKQLHFKFAACPDVAGSESKCKYHSFLSDRR